MQHSKDLSPIVADICFFIAQQGHAMQQYPTAEYWYNLTLRLQPHNPEVHHALTYVTALQRRYDEAVKHASFAMKGQHSAMAQYARALIYLAKGDYEKGFVDYDVRLKFALNEQSRFERFGNLPYWKGEPCKILHVSGEQGYGDIFMFSRFIPLIKEKFNVEKIFFEVPKSCNSFFKYNFRDSPEIEVVSEYWNPVADYHIQLVSLCKLFKVTLDTIPSVDMKAEPEYVEKWKEKLAPFREKYKKIVSVCYAGRQDADASADMQVAEWNARRNLPFDEINKIFSEFSYTLFIPVTPDLNPEIVTWSDTAGVMANSDLTISADSGPAHMAGVLNVPVWLLNHYQTCWRWTLEHEHTPWYNNNLRIFRQIKEGDWTPVLEKVKQELANV